MITLTKDKYLSESEVDDLMRVLKLMRLRSHRDSLLIELALYSGIREGELLTLTKADLDPSERTVFVREPEKGSSKREIPLPKDLFERLWSYAQTTDERIFPITTARVRQVWGSVRLVPKKFHSLRHSFARRVYANTKDIRLVQYLLGHRSISSTLVYTSIDYEASATRKAMGI